VTDAPNDLPAHDEARTGNHWRAFRGCRQRHETADEIAMIDVFIHAIIASLFRR
jgi:hypothetical protein